MALAAVVAVAGCSQGNSAKKHTTASVGTEAVRVDLPGYASLLVSKGSLSANQAVTLAVDVAPPLAPPTAPVGNVLSLTPHGTQFLTPVTVNIAYPAAAADPSELIVLRLAGDQGTEWTEVGGATFSTDSRTGLGVATFETSTFSYYAIVKGKCTLIDDSVACSTTCECCGTASCVNLATDPHNCGACGNDCGAAGFCTAASSCQSVATASLCENPSVYVMQGALPPLSVVAPEQQEDSLNQTAVSNALTSHCAGVGHPITITTVKQSTSGVLDPCTNGPLIGAGNTIILVGGSWSQRMASYLNGDSGRGGTPSPGGSPVKLTYSSATDSYTFTTASGALIKSFPNKTLSPSHDFFVVSVEAEPAHGALVLQVWGVGWEGTPAAVWYFQNRVLPAIEAGTPIFGSYQLVEWTDGGTMGAKDALDTFNVLATDLL